MNTKYILIFILFCFFSMPVFYSSAENIEIDQLLDQVANAITSQSQIEWQTIVLSTVKEFDKKGNVTKETKMKRRMITRKNDKVENEILEVLETEDGKTNDITRKSVEQSDKRQEKNENEDTKGTSLGEDQLFPFDKNSRSRYLYRRMDDTQVNGRPVFVIETKAKEPDSDTYEGRYYFDKDLYKIIKLNVKPSKTPMFISELSIEIDFKIVDENLSLIEKLVSRMKGKVLFKYFNVLIEENYTECQIL